MYAGGQRYTQPLAGDEEPVYERTNTTSRRSSKDGRTPKSGEGENARFDRADTLTRKSGSRSSRDGETPSGSSSRTPKSSSKSQFNRTNSMIARPQPKPDDSATPKFNRTLSMSASSAKAAKAGQRKSRPSQPPPEEDGGEDAQKFGRSMTLGTKPRFKGSKDAPPQQVDAGGGSSFPRSMTMGQVDPRRERPGKQRGEGSEGRSSRSGVSRTSSTTGDYSQPSAVQQLKPALKKASISSTPTGSMGSDGFSPYGGGFEEGDQQGYAPSRMPPQQQQYQAPRSPLGGPQQYPSAGMNGSEGSDMSYSDGSYVPQQQGYPPQQQQPHHARLASQDSVSSGRGGSRGSSRRESSRQQQPQQPMQMQPPTQGYPPQQQAPAAHYRRPSEDGSDVGVPNSMYPAPQQQIGAGDPTATVAALLPVLPPPGAPQVVQCQRCAQLLEVPLSLPPAKKGVQKLRCGKCLKVSRFQLNPLDPRAGAVAMAVPPPAQMQPAPSPHMMPAAAPSPHMMMGGGYMDPNASRGGTPPDYNQQQQGYAANPQYAQQPQGYPPQQQMQQQYPPASSVGGGMRGPPQGGMYGAGGGGDMMGAGMPLQQGMQQQPQQGPPRHYRSASRDSDDSQYLSEADYGNGAGGMPVATPAGGGQVAGPRGGAGGSGRKQVARQGSVDSSGDVSSGSGTPRDDKPTYRRQVVVNGEPVRDDHVQIAEGRAGPIHPGNYWYDCVAGFWGEMGGPCLGIIPPNIDFGAPIPRNCAGGSTRVVVNGRELHKKDLDRLMKRGLPATPNMTYRVEITGNVYDNETGEMLMSLGKLAPSLETRKRGGGMKIPEF